METIFKTPSSVSVHMYTHVHTHAYTLTQYVNGCSNKGTGDVVTVDEMCNEGAPLLLPNAI